MHRSVWDLEMHARHVTSTAEAEAERARRLAEARGERPGRGASARALVLTLGERLRVCFKRAPVEPVPGPVCWGERSA